MNLLLEKGLIQKLDCGNNLAYILKENSYFSSTEYKVLLSQGDVIFVKMMKMQYNGNVQFYYLTNGLKSFSSLLSSLEAENFMTIVANLLRNIIEVKNNGFLSCKNIDISYEHIFVDLKTYKVSLIYLPTNIHFYEDDYAFENDLRTELIKTIKENITLQNYQTEQFAVNLSNGLLNLNDLYNRVKNGNSIVNQQKTNIKKLQIIAINQKEKFVIDITRDEFVIGKKVELVDQAITFNRMISRVHCKINRNGNIYTVTDLHSANGTYVNRVKLQPDEPHPLKNGDILRLANSDFQVLIE